MNFPNKLIISAQVIHISKYFGHTIEYTNIQ